jgi:ABC-type nitrate/sulfonate/bicarbonate transport system substrate-binding protein
LQGGVATNSAFLNGRREVAQRFIGATVKGLKYFKSERSGTAKVMTKYMNLNADTAARVYDESVPSFVTDGTISEDFQDRVLEFELKTIGTDKKMSRDKVFDFSLTKNVTNR